LKTMKSATLTVLVCLLLVVPFGLAFGPGLRFDRSADGGDGLESPTVAGALSLTFPQVLNTSQNVSEYPLGSRALILPDGVSDMFLWDMNGDTLDDLVASVYLSKSISIFYRQPDGSFETYPSFNITTADRPFRILPIDVFNSSDHQIIALERGLTYTDTRFVIYNLTSESSYEVMPDHSTYSNATDFVVGDFSGDEYPDVAVACKGSTPLTNKGRIQVFFGHDFTSFEMFMAGWDTQTVAAGDFDDDGVLELAVANAASNDTSVMLFKPPFDLFTVPYSILPIAGTPTSISTGRLDGDALDDLAVATESPSTIHFFVQSLGSLGPPPEPTISLIQPPSWILATDMNTDSRHDLLVLSASGNVTFGHYQRTVEPLWDSSPDVLLPAAGSPRAAVVGDLDGDSLTDLAIAGARADWSGPSLAICPNKSPSFSNSDMTAWLGTSASPTVIASGDLNGDDVQDLVTIDPVSSSIGYQFSFQGTYSTILLGYEPRDLMVSDLDLDGLYDIVVVQENGPTVTVVMGSSSFPSASVDMTCGGSITDASLGDFNNDGFLDLVVATAETSLALFNNTRSPVPFAGYYNLGSTPPGSWSISAGDYNSDGMTDIAYTKSVRKIVVMLQSSAVAFGPLSPTLNLTHTVGSDFTRLWSGDVTGDGKTDIVASRPADPSLYLFDQEDFETSPHPYATLDLPEVPEFVSVVDATDDGHLDVVAVFAEFDLLYLYRHDSGSLPSSPSMVFVTGADPCYATIGDGTGDNRGDLLVNDAGSHSVSVWRQNNFAPVADAGGPYVTRQGDLLQINGTVETGTSEIPYMLYYWDFGDGETNWTDQVRPLHNYTSVGSYIIQMIAYDPAGLFDISASNVEVLDAVPHAAFSWSPDEIEEGRNITFVDDTWSFDPTVSRSWSVDGAPTGDQSSIVIAFQNGTHQVVLTVEDSDGSVGIASYSVDALSKSPDLELVAYGVQPFGEGYLVTFFVEVDKWHFVLNGTIWEQQPVDPITTYEWDFSNVPGTFVPDPEAPNSANVTHVFSSTTDAKVFRVAVRVNDSDGMDSNASLDILVNDSGPVAGFQLSDPAPRESVPFTFISTSASYDGIDSWLWTLEHPNGTLEDFPIDGRAMEELPFSNLQDGDYTMSLTISESDGDDDTVALNFHVQEIAPEATIKAITGAEDDGTYQEFTTVNFISSVTSLDPAVQFEWDFEAVGSDFTADTITFGGTASHSYSQIGNYTVKVRVTDSDGSTTTQSMLVNISNKPIRAGFSPSFTDIRILRSVPATNVLTFNASFLAMRYPDIVALDWDFGDGESLSVSGVPAENIVHNYTLGADYYINVTAEDDDGYTAVISTKVWMVPPVITLIEPVDDGVIRSGAPIMFLISSGSTPIASVSYDINDTGFRSFPTQYVINTTGWTEGQYRIQVVAWDAGGNLAIFRYLFVTIDDSNPSAFLSSTKQTVYAGDRFNMTLKVFDRNVEAAGVVLFIKFPGDKIFLPYSTSKGSDGSFYRIMQVPETEGTIELYANITDLAGNSHQTSVYTLSLRLHFVDWAWPYMLSAALLATMGTAGYFMREQKIAVDEVFVIYKDGRMITHSTRRLKPGMDDHVLGGMLVAIQDFVRESFKDITSFKLRRLEFGEKSVLVEKGDHVYLAVLLHGQTSRKIALKMQKVVEEIELKFGPQLKDWDGDFEKMRGVGDEVKKLYSKMPMFPGRRTRNT